MNFSMKFGSKLENIDRYTLLFFLIFCLIMATKTIFVTMRNNANYANYLKEALDNISKLSFGINFFYQVWIER